ncbi:MAG TPA: hypothetical protein VMF69_23540 [Gemmataceae bacterium]|nr:hypothetical protein [Gemmataceae bacterium]
MKRWILGLATLALLLGAVEQTKAEPIPPGGSGIDGGSFGGDIGGGGAPAGNDPSFGFTFSDAQGDAGYGTLNAVPSGLGDGSYMVTSGTLVLTSSSNDSTVPTGTYDLIGATMPVPNVSPNGAFSYDDLLYPTDNAGSGFYSKGLNGDPSYLTVSGLAFGYSDPTSPLEINIYAKGDDDYAFLAATAIGKFSIDVTSGGAFVLTSEPAGFALFGIGAVCLGLYAWRRWKKAAA